MKRLLLVLFFLLPKMDSLYADPLIQKAKTLFEQGYFTDAIAVAEQVVAAREASHEPDDLETAMALHELGRISTAMLHTEKAEASLLRAIQIRERKLGSDHPDTARTIALLADFYRKTGKMKEAEALFERAIGTMERSISPETPDLVEVLTNFAKHAFDSGKYAQAEERLGRAMLIGGKAWGRNHPHVARAISELAILRKSQGNNQEAEELLLQARLIQESTIGIEHPDTLETLNKLAILYADLAKYEPAETLHRQVLQTREKRLGPSHPAVASSLNNQAVLLMKLGRFPEAEPLLLRATEIEEKVYGPYHYHVATDLSNLAILYTFMGRYSDAEPYYKRALEAIRKNPTPRALGFAWNNLGLHYSETGRFTEAEAAYRKALESWNELGEHPLVAVVCSNLAKLLLRTQQQEHTEKLLQRSLHIRESVLGPEHPETADALYSFGSYWKSKDRLQEAEPLLNRALRVWEKSSGEDSPFRARALYKIGHIYHLSGRSDEGESLIRKAIDLQKRSLGEEHPYLVHTYATLGSVLVDTRRHVEAHDNFYQSAWIQSLVRENAHALLSERQKLSLSDMQLPVLHTFVSHTASFLQRNTKATEQAFSMWLMWKGSVQDSQARHWKAAFESKDPQLKKKWEELTETRRQIARMWLAGPGKKGAELYQQIVFELRLKKEALEAELSRLSHSFADEQRLDAQTIRKLLPENAVYLDYARVGFYNFHQKEALRTHYVLFTITSRNSPAVQIYDLGAANKIESLIQKYRESLQSVAESGKPDRQQTRKMQRYAEELYGLLIKPAQPAFREKTHLLISPDAALHLFPWEVLIDSQGRSLLERFEITYLTSGRDVIRWNDAPSLSQEAIVIADPDYDASIDQGNTESISSALLRSADPKTLHFSPLPDSRQEGKMVSNILNEEMGIRTTLYLDHEAIDDVLISARSPRIIHLATHGFFLPDNPHDTGGFQDLTVYAIPEATWEHPSLRSGFVLAGANHSLKFGGDNGIFTAMKIEGLQIHGTELVVISACDTARGTIRSGEGVFGLKRSFLQTGVQTLILSLWKVPDSTTRELMTTFYSLWSAGLSKSTALRRARLQLRQKYDHPFYWAAFQIAGNPR